MPAISENLGPWVMINDQRMPAEVEEELGTKDYISRTYINKDAASRPAQRSWDRAVQRARRTGEPVPDAEINRLAASALENDPYARVTLHVAYYTGSVDTVPHIPDRCMLGAGFEMSTRDAFTLDVPNEQAQDLMVSFRQFQQRDNSGAGNDLTNSVAYFFHVNGDYEHDAIVGVRKRLQDLFESHAYFAKVEVSVIAPTAEKEIDTAKAAMAGFLRDALPDIERVLPDWDTVKAEQDRVLADAD
jgi:hypothetical protein